MVNFDVSTTGPPPIFARHTFSHPFVDLVFSGVGWVSFACSGPIQVKTHVLRGLEGGEGEKNIYIFY